MSPLLLGLAVIGFLTIVANVALLGAAIWLSSREKPAPVPPVTLLQGGTLRRRPVSHRERKVMR